MHCEFTVHNVFWSLLPYYNVIFTRYKMCCMMYMYKAVAWLAGVLSYQERQPMIIIIILVGL